jgi:hypothetical protein
MKKISDFKNEKMSFKDMNGTFGGANAASMCTCIIETSHGCGDVGTVTMNDEGKVLEYKEVPLPCPDPLNLPQNPVA